MMKQSKLKWAAVVAACLLALGYWYAFRRDADPAQVQAEPAQLEAGDDAVAVKPSPAADGAKPTSSESDAACEKLLAEGNHAEAIDWLSEAARHHGVPKWEKSEVTAWVQKFYDAGAVRVTAVDISTVADTEISDEFVVELPSEPAARKKLFSVEADFQSQYDDAPTPDRGQRFLDIIAD